MNIISILPKGLSCLFWIVFTFSSTIIIRFILCYFKAIAVKQGEADYINEYSKDGEILKEIKSFKKEPLKDIFWSLFRSNKNDIHIDDYFLSTIVGIAELFAFPVLIARGKWHFIGYWLLIKTATQWGVWQKSRTAYNRFLFGNILSLFFSYILYSFFFSNKGGNMTLFLIAIIIGVLFFVLIILKFLPKSPYKNEIKLTDLVQVMLMAILVYVTIFYAQETSRIASETKKSADASQSMALEMKRANQANLSPSLSIIPMQPYYDKNGDLTMPYVVVNTGNTSVLYKKSHRIFKVNKESGQKEEIKPWCKESMYTDRLSPKESSWIHLDTMGKYFIKEENLKNEYFLVELGVDCKNEIDVGYGISYFTRLVAFSAKSYIEEGRNEFFQIFFPPKYEGYENNKLSEEVSTKEERVLIQKTE